MNKLYDYIGRNCAKQFSQVVDIKTSVSDMKILCTVDQDVFHCQIFLTRDTVSDENGVEVIQATDNVLHNDGDEVLQDTDVRHNDGDEVLQAPDVVIHNYGDDVLHDPGDVLHIMEMMC